MPEIFITIRDKLPMITGDVRSIVADNSDYTIRFDFDDDWTDGEKTVFFVRSNGYVFEPAIMTDDTVAVPVQVDVDRMSYLMVGVQQGDLKTSRPCSIPLHISITDKIEDDAVQPEASMWEAFEKRLTKLEEGGAGGGITSETDPTVPDWAKEPTKPSYSKTEVGLGNVDNVRQYSAQNPPPYPVTSVNGKTGAVKLAASDVGALPASTKIPSKTSELANDSGFITEESDPTVPDWAKEPTKPSYSKTEVGLGNVDNVRQYSAQNPPPYPVTSVNGKTGAVKLAASDVGARPSTWMPTASDVGALPASTVIPSKTSELANDSGFITRLVADLANYYAKSDTYSREEIDAKVSAIPKFSISVVSSLPTSGISATTVYLVGGGTGSDLYTEYIYVNGAWELLGAQTVDLTGYATETWVNSELNGINSDMASLDRNVASLRNTVTSNTNRISNLEDNAVTGAELDSAVDAALEEAKESGEFDGKDGRGIVAVVRTAGTGAAGTTDTYTITFTDGTTSTFTVYNGKDGGDYVLTDADKSDIAAEVLTMLPTWEGGSY